jgi:hypothetical protein
MALSQTLESLGNRGIKLSALFYVEVKIGLLRLSALFYIEVKIG